MRWIYLLGFLGIAGTFIADLWTDIDYRVAANVSLIYIAVLVTIFTGLYGLRSRWRGYRIGQIFLAKGIVLALVLWQIVIAQWISADYPFRQHIRFAIYSLGAVVYLPMLISLWREQRRDRKQGHRG